MNKGIFACALLGALVTGCDASTTDTLPANLTHQLETALASQNPSKAADLFTSDAEIMNDGQPVVRGRRDIEHYLAEQMYPTIRFDAHPRMSVVRDDIALESGSYTFRDVRKGRDVEHGKYMHAWRRAASDWKLFSAMYNTDKPSSVRVSVTDE